MNADLEKHGGRGAVRVWTYSKGFPVKKPLRRCANGCEAPPKPPSLVLCAACFAALDEKMEGLLDLFSPPRVPPEGR